MTDIKHYLWLPAKRQLPDIFSAFTEVSDISQLQMLFINGIIEWIVVLKPGSTFALIRPYSNRDEDDI